MRAAAWNKFDARLSVNFTDACQPRLRGYAIKDGHQYETLVGSTKPRTPTGTETFSVDVAINFNNGATVTDADASDLAQLVAAALQAATLPTGVTLTGTNTLTFDSTWTGTAVTFDLSAVTDAFGEPTEDFNVELSNATTSTSGSAGYQNQTVTTEITDATQVDWTISRVPDTIYEDPGAGPNTAVFNVSFQTAGLAAGQTVSVQLGFNADQTTADDFTPSLTNFYAAVANDIGAAGNTLDGNGTYTFDSVSGVLTVTATNDISAGNPLVSFDLTAANDTLYESDENFEVTLTDVDTGDTVADTVATPSITTTIVSDDTPPDDSLLGVLVVNEVGLNTGDAIIDRVGGKDLAIPAGESYIEIKNLSTNASDTSGSKVPLLRMEITNGSETLYVSLQDVGTIDAKNYLVLYEGGKWVQYQEDGTVKSFGDYRYFDPTNPADSTAPGTGTNANGAYGPGDWSDVMPAGMTTSDPLGVSLYQIINGDVFTVDGLLANGVDIGSNNEILGDANNNLTLGNVIWNGAANFNVPADAAALLGPLTDASQYNGRIGDQYATIQQMASLAALLPVMLVDNNDTGAGIQNTDDTSHIYSRSFYETGYNLAHLPDPTGDKNADGDPINADSNQESDWTTNYTSTQGFDNTVDFNLGPMPVDDPNSQDTFDNTDPDQAYKTGGIDNSGVDAQFAGQSILTTAGNDTVHPTQILGGDGQDLLYGTSGSDDIHGGTNNDLLYGGAGNDSLYGDSGADLLVDISGQDYLDGGIGDDILIAGAELKVWDSGASTFVDTSVLPGWNTADSQAALVHNSDPNTFATTFEDTLIGGPGNDVLIGGPGDDSLSGGTGSDFLNGGGGQNVLDVGIGTVADYVQFTGEVLDGGDLPDQIANFDQGNDVVDLSELLDVAGGENITEYVRIQNVSGETQVQIDSNGLAGGSSYDHVIATFDGGLATGSAVNILYDDSGIESTNAITVVI